MKTSQKEEQDYEQCTKLKYLESLRDDMKKVHTQINNTVKAIALDWTQKLHDHATQFTSVWAFQKRIS